MIGVVGGSTPKPTVISLGAGAFWPFCAAPMSGRARNDAQTPTIRTRFECIELLLMAESQVRSPGAAEHTSKRQGLGGRRGAGRQKYVPPEGDYFFSLTPSALSLATTFWPACAVPGFLSMSRMVPSGPM